LVRKSHFTKDFKDHQTYDNCYAFAIQSMEQHILTFHVMTDYGMLRSRVPISEVFWKEPANDLPFYMKQLWDCYGTDVTVLAYSFLKNHRCEVILRDHSKVWATYLFTVDWVNNPYTDTPSDYACGHVLFADDGYLLCQPNNRIFWKDSNWVTKDFENPREMKVDTELLSVESVADRWISEDTDSFYYLMRKK
jgi:hypothetical protein